MALSDLSKPDLEKLAADANIDGRSKMDKPELVAALEAAGVEAPPVEEPAEEADLEREVSVSRLIEESQARLGVPPHVAAGALHDREPDDELTASDARELVQSWLTSDVEEA